MKDLELNSKQKCLYRVSKGLDNVILTLFLIFLVTLSEVFNKKINVYNLLGATGLFHLLYVLYNSFKLYQYKLEEIDNAIKDIENN